MKLIYLAPFLFLFAACGGDDGPEVEPLPSVFYEGSFECDGFTAENAWVAWNEESGRVVLGFIPPQSTKFVFYDKPGAASGTSFDTTFIFDSSTSVEDFEFSGVFVNDKVTLIGKRLSDDAACTGTLTEKTRVALYNGSFECRTAPADDAEDFTAKNAVLIRDRAGTTTYFGISPTTFTSTDVGYANVSNKGAVVLSDIEGATGAGTSNDLGFTLTLPSEFPAEGFDMSATLKIDAADSLQTCSGQF